jgi:hypothetical protein
MFAFVFKMLKLTNLQFLDKRSSTVPSLYFRDNFVTSETYLCIFPIKIA